VPTSKYLFDSAKLAFSDERVRVETYPQEKWRCSFSISVDGLNLNGHISSMAQIIDALGLVFSAVDHLILDYEEDGRSSE